jgi:hypothetical protein
MIWKSPLPGRGASSPIVWGDRVFLTAFDGYGLDEEEPGDKADLKLHVLCLELASGKLLWDQSIAANPRTQGLTRRVADHGYATSTPVTDGEAVYAFFGVSGVIAFDFDGNEMWRRDVGDGSAGFGTASSPVVHGDLVYVNASIESKTLFALDRKSGEVVWKVGEINRAWTSPCIGRTASGVAELVLNQKDTVYGFDPATGKQLWSCDGIHDYVVPVPVTHQGVVYCLGGRSNRCLAIRLGGRGDVTDTHKLWEVTTGANVTSPVHFQGRLYWASDKGVANCLDAKTGESIFRERLPTRSRIYASIVRAGSKLYVTTRDKGVLVLNAAEKYEELARNVIADDQDMMNASPAIIGDRLLLRTDSFLYCVGQK